MLVEHDLFGNTYDKVADAIKIAQMFEPPDGEGYYLAYSGGKDSVCVKRILDMAGVKYDTHYAVTAVDPPELVRFVISQFDHVIYDMPDETHRYFDVVDGQLTPAKEIPSEENAIHFSIPTKPMIKLIPHKRMPPTRIARYCCKELKEIGGQFRRVVTGVRKAESVNREKNQGMVTITSKDEAEAAKDFGVNFTQTNRGGWC